MAKQFIGRQMAAEDAGEVARRWAPSLPDGDEMMHWLPKVLHECISKDLIRGGVVQSLDDKKHIAAFGLSTFIPWSIHDDFFADPHPYLNARLMNCYRDGEHEVFLDQRKQAEGNKGDGLMMCVLEYYAENHNYEDPTALGIANRIIPEYLKVHRGFNIRKNIQEIEEIFGQLQLRGGQEELIRFDEQHPFSFREGGLGPRVVYGLERTNEPGFAAAGVAHQITNYHPPTLNLVPREQETVLAALQGMTDRAISEHFHISVDAVKQRWKSLYTQIETVEPDFFNTPNASGDGNVRGAEKRRIVLAKLSDRYSELRPHCLRRG